MAAANISAPGDTGAVTIRKLQRRILPLLFLLYVVAYLDRINIGFAALTMNSALSVTSAQFGLLLGIFFWGYFIFEIPSNLLLHKMGARVWIARILISWGIVATLTGAVQNVPQLYVARFTLGVTEAGFFPGIILYLTYWFREREQARMIALFAIALPISNIVGAPLSGFILDHAHWAAIGSWRWLLILEGLPAIGCGILTWYVLPSRPADAKFLSAEEKDWIATELAREHRAKAGDRLPSVWRTLAHPRLWQMAGVLFGFDVGLYGMTFYMPQAMKTILSGHSNAAVGGLVMVPHLAGLAAMILVSRSSDRRLERRFHSGLPLFAAGIALLALGLPSPPFLAICFWSAAAMGLYGFFGPFFAMPGTFLTGSSAAAGIALINSFGNLGGFVGPSIVGAMAGGKHGIYGGLAVAGLSLFVSAALAMLMPKERNGGGIVTNCP